MKSGKKVQAWGMGLSIWPPACCWRMASRFAAAHDGQHWLSHDRWPLYHPDPRGGSRAVSRGCLSRERSLQIIDVALSAGCSIEESDEVGSTPLVAAILFNEPELVRLLLQRCSDPYRRITSPKPYLNGLDAFGFLQLLQERLPAENRQAIRGEFERYRQER